MSPRKSLISKDVTIRDVAVEAGVSVTLVSFVLNAKMGPNGEYLCSASQSTAKRIIEAAKKLGYHKNTVASSLRSGHRMALHVLKKAVQFHLRKLFLLLEQEMLSVRAVFTPFMRTIL